jgi:hypothetical protein
LKDEEAINWKERFRNFHWKRGINSRKGHGGLPKKRRVSYVREGEKRRMNVLGKY